MSYRMFAATYELEELLSPISGPISRALSLSCFPRYFPLMLFSYASFQTVQLVSPYFLSRISVHFQKAHAHTKHDWTSRVVSTLHATVIILFAFSTLDIPELERNRAFGFNERVGDMSAIACGYFLWDTLECIFHFRDLGFVIHAVMCLLVYAIGFRPFLAYYSPRFLIWELSTPLLNFHWFLDKSNRSGSCLQLVNGVILILTFVTTRICYGGYMALQFLYTLRVHRSEIPYALAIAYGLGNVILNGLNYYWLYKMISSLRRRLDPKAASQSSQKYNSALANPTKDKVKSN